MKVRAFSLVFDSFTCWSELDSRQSFGRLIRKDGGALSFSFSAMNFAFETGRFEILEDAA